MKKKLYWLLESNGDLSVTCSTIETIKDLIEGDMQDLTKEEQEETEYTITPVWYTDEEYASLPEL